MKMTGKAHAERSASGSEIWLNCPGSVNLARKVTGVPVESPYAVEGTTAHDLHEKIANVTFKGKAGGFSLKPYPPAMVKAVRFSIDEIAKILGRRRVEVLVEEKVFLEPIDSAFIDMFGTVDVAIVEEFGTLDVIDYKHGSGVKVDVYKETAGGWKSLNTQLVYYALGLAKRYEFNFRNVRLAIIQPRCKQGAPVSEVTVTMREVMSYIDLFKNGVERTKRKDARRFPGPWCRFCKAKPICKDAKEGYRTPSRDDFDVL